MSSKIFRQYDSRWSKKPYPNSKSLFGGNGCGCCAVTHLLIENAKYANYTPESIRPWMVKQGFAVTGQGTTWNGITETMKHYGLKNIVRVWDDPMSKAWKALNKGNKMGIILFIGGIKGGVTWTLGGHYVAFTNYKVVDGRHYFYTKDSGNRKHDGWYCYETTMKGLIAKVWICDRPNSTSKPTSKPTSTKLAVDGKMGGKTIKAMQKWLKVKQDGILGKVTIKALQKKLKVTRDGIWGKNTTKALQKLVGVKVDGILGINTIKGLQTYLNKIL